MDPETFRLLRDAGIPSGFLAILLYLQFQKRNEHKEPTLPSGMPADVLRMIAGDAREVSRLLDELNRAEDRASRRHDEAMDMLRNVYDEVRDQKRTPAA